jgi:hypothetical protein
MSENAPTIDNVISRIQAWIAGHPRQKLRIADMAGLVPNTLKRVEAPDWAPKVETIRALEALIPPGWRIGDPVEPLKERDSTHA